MKKLVGIYFFSLLFIHSLLGQTDREVVAERAIEDLLDRQNGSGNLDEAYEQLYQYYLTPLNLNTASRDDLEKLNVLSTKEMDCFFNHIHRFGKLESIYELQAIEGWNLELIKRIVPFVTVQPYYSVAKFWKRMKENTNHYVMYRIDIPLEQKKGYEENDYGRKTYIGSPYKHLIRYRNSIGRDYSMGFTLEKDAGEHIAWNTTQKQYGFDYLSAHVFLFNKGKIKALGLGDYAVQFGQGLVVGAGYFLGKSSETILGVKRSSRGAMPYNSVVESGFMRGVCATLAAAKNIDVTIFYSHNKRDASLQFDTSRNTMSATSFITYGVHRTNQEIENKRNLTEQSLGGNISYTIKNEKFRLGGTVLYTKFDTPVQEANRVYNKFDFKGQENLVGSIDFHYVWQNIHTFGEAAFCGNGSHAYLVGALASVSPSIDVSFLHRNFSPKYHSFYANAFAENTFVANEKGYYWGVKIKVNLRWLLSAYYDVFEFPWLRYQRDKPSNGNGSLGRITFSPSKKVSLYWQGKYETSEQNSTESLSKLSTLTSYRLYQLMFNLDYKVDYLVLHSRVQWTQYNELSNTIRQGFLASQDIGVIFRKVKLTTRFALFDTDDYDTRQYVYEKDVLYSFSFPSYSGAGSRRYLIVQYKAGRHFDLWLRYSITTYLNQSSIGSGDDEIAGNRVREVKLQCRYKF